MISVDYEQVVYNGNGIQNAWPYSFPIYDGDVVRLILLDADGTETNITQDYFVDVPGSTVYYPGYAPGAEPPLEDQPPKVQTGQKLIVYRDTEITQDSDLGDSWPFNVIEKGLDKLTMILQEKAFALARCLKISQGQAAEIDDYDPTVPLEADKVICGNANGTGFDAREAMMEVNGAWDGEGRQIKGVADPADNQDAATKNYVDTLTDNNFMKLQADGTAWEGRNLPISNVAGPALVKDAANKDYVDRILAGYSGQGDRFVFFDNVAQMQAAELVPSQMAVTLGYHDVNDGGAGVYTIRDKGADTPDGGSIIEIPGTDYVAELITDGTVNVKQFGAYGDGIHDDTDAIQNAIDSLPTTTEHYNTVEIKAVDMPTVVLPVGTYAISSTIVLKGNVSLVSFGKNATEIKATASMDEMIKFAGVLEGVHSVFKFAEIGQFYLNCDGLAKHGIYNADNIWCDSINVHDIIISRATELGLDVASTWSSTYRNIRISGSPVGAYFGANDNGNGCNNNIFENINISNTYLVGLILDCQGCVINCLNIDRQRDYMRSDSIVADSVTIHGNTYTDNTAMLATRYCDTTEINGLWMEWISSTSNTPAVLTKDIITYGNGQFRALNLSLNNVHFGTTPQDAFKILSGKIIITGCRADIVGENYNNLFIDTYGADANTSLIIRGYHAENIIRWIVSGKVRNTLRYGAFQVEGYGNNGSTTVKYASDYSNKWTHIDGNNNIVTSESIIKGTHLVNRYNLKEYQRVSQQGYPLLPISTVVGFYGQTELPQGQTTSVTKTTTIKAESDVTWEGVPVIRNAASLPLLAGGCLAYIDTDSDGYITVKLYFGSALPSGDTNVHVLLFPYFSV